MNPLLTRETRAVLDLIKKNPHRSAADIAYTLNISQVSAHRHIRRLTDKGLLRKIVMWEVVDPNV